jgi:hypothetical protein
MAFSLEKVVPWGRSFEEYHRMFALSDEDLQRRILGCADGPASFNAEASQRGACVVSVDPIYAFSRREIQRRIDETYEEVIAQTRRNQADFVWKNFRTVDELGQARTASMQRFLDDFDAGLRARRYLAGELPSLPFDDGEFDLAVCSHFLFLYSDQLSEAFHVESTTELCRIAGEVRIFPLVSLDGLPSCHVEPVADAARRGGRKAQVLTVPYEFQRGANQMLRIV